MTDSSNTSSGINIPDQCDVAIIGGGPSGLSAATELKKLGVKSVIVLEREAVAGGIPRHCGHSPFGMREFKRILSGTEYTKRLYETAKNAGVTFCLNTTVASIAKGGELELSSNTGLHHLKATKVIICTGIRETPRSTRLVSGQRPLGIVTTGALQSTIYLKHKKPFKHPVIIGTELVSFSALFSCLHSGSRPVAMIEQNSRITAKWGMQFLAALFRVPIYYNTQLSRINGKNCVEGIEIEQDQKAAKILDCDGVIFSGQFVAESSLLRMGHLDVDKVGNPIIDQFGRCSDTDYFATGNMTHPVETAGHCWSHGIKTAQHVFESLNGKLDNYKTRLNISSSNKIIKYCVPQLLAITESELKQQSFSLQLRMTSAVKGLIYFNIDRTTVSKKAISALPERRIEFTLSNVALTAESTLELCFEDD